MFVSLQLAVMRNCHMFLYVSCFLWTGIW